MGFFKALSLASYLMGWYARASADGEITHEEMIEGIAGACSALGLDASIDVTPAMAEAMMQP